MNPSDRKWLRSPSERVGTLSHADLPPPATAPIDEEQVLILALRDRNEVAFEWLLDRYYTPMLRLAQSYVRSREEAEEVVQDAWLAVLAGIETFEGRSSLKTWIFRILVNRARSRGVRESRQIPFSSLGLSESPDFTRADSAPDWILGSASSAVQSWEGEAWRPPGPEEAVLSEELFGVVEAAVAALPRRQQIVITLRDVEGWPADEVCALLDISEANQRVLLHRARLKVRDSLAGYLAPAERADPVRTGAD